MSIKFAPDADTGWRDLSSSLINGWTGMILVRRIGRLVEWRLKIHGDDRTDVQFLNIPVGYRPGNPSEGALFLNNGTAMWPWVPSFVSASDGQVEDNGSYFTDDEMPAS